MLAALISVLLTASDTPRIVIDGSFDDWDGVPVQLTDPADAAGAAVDFGELRVSHDDRFLHLLVDFGAVVNIQRLEGTARLLLDADGDPATGDTAGGLEGVDAIIEMTPPHPDAPRRRGRGAALRLASEPGPLSPYAVGFTVAPTWASRVFELRLERGELLRAPRLRGRLQFEDPRGIVRDETDVFEYELPPVAPTPDGQPVDPLAKPAGSTLRVAIWNAQLGAFLDEPDAAGRVLRAIDPDVILFQELGERNTAAELEGFLNERIRGRARWRAVIGAGGGNLRSAVAARVPLEECPSLAIVPYPDRPGRSVRVAAAVVGTHPRILAVSVHLRCCGRAGSFEDRTRTVEAIAVRRAVAAALRDGAYDGVVIAGDLNLVGSRLPLELLAEGIDGDGSALAVAGPNQIDGRSNATWSDAGQPFVPGRLDFLLYSDASLSLARSFVLDTRDLSPRWLKNHRLRPADTADASDHLPIVADLDWCR